MSEKIHILISGPVGTRKEVIRIIMIASLQQAGYHVVYGEEEFSLIVVKKLTETT